MLGNKKGLFDNLSEYCEYRGLNKYDFIPFTFSLSHNNSEEWKKFEKQFAKQNRSSQKFWIVKPGENSNQGKGIFLTKDIKQIKKAHKNSNYESLIIQKYISDVFLFNKRKIDIRTYFLAVTLNGVVKFYWYDEGYIRTCSMPYDLSDNDAMIHLTNDAIQVECEKYSEYEIGNKISYNDFQRYLKHNDYDYNMTKLHN